MPGFIRQKAALPHREPSAAKGSPATKLSPAKKAASQKRSLLVDLTSSPDKATCKKRAAEVDLTTPTKAVSKKRSSFDTPASPSSPSTTTQSTKKTRTVAPSPSTSATAAPKSFPLHESSLPGSLPANGQDYLHDPSGLLSALIESYNVATMQIISSSKMSAKVARSLDTLVLGKIDMADVKCKPGLVVMYAKAPVSGKLISVVEVVKREMGQKGKKWYQYSALSESMVVIPRQKPKSTQKKGEVEKEGKEGNGDEEMEVDGDEEEESYFETMKTKQERVLEGTDRVRAVPVLTVYLSRVPIEKLKQKYGEQTNAKK